MNRATAFFLILLRLAIGWHFLFEGLHKLHTTDVGPTETNKPFSSAGYFREDPGPLARVFRSAIGDPDQQALALLDVQPIPPDQDPRNYPAHLRTPPALAQAWDDYLARFDAHYGLTDKQRALAKAKEEQEEDKVVLWLTGVSPDSKEKIKRIYPSGSVERELTTPERINEYRDRLQELHSTLSTKLWAFGHDVEGKRLSQTKAAVADIRTGLLDDLDKHTTELKKTLEEGADLLTDEQKAKGPVPAPPPSKVLHWVDFLTEWGLTVIGACLLLGLFTRLNCVLAAGFLLMTYLCAPAFPWLPVPPNTEGYYAFVNKNVVEMLACLTLATTASGRWLGLDAILHWFFQAVFGKKPAPKQA